MSEYRDWYLETDIDGIAWLWADRAGESMNSLSVGMLDELSNAIDRIEREQPTGLVIASAKPSGFIAGADVREFDQLTDVGTAGRQIRSVHALFERIASLPCTTIAAVHGVCLGGGLELALACDYRIALDDPGTRVGFPEIKLGIFPGFGGTARSVRLLGGRRAMELMLTGRTLRARQAKAIGLLDELVGRHRSLRWAARAAAQAKRRSRYPGTLARVENTAPVRALLSQVMAREVRRRAPPQHYPAPTELLELWRRRGGDYQRLLDGEAERVPRLLLGEVSTNLRRVFRLMERLKALGRAEGGEAPFTARRVHVVGAGVMGGDIAAWCAYRGLEVTLQDREPRLIEPALARARKLFGKLREPTAIRAARGRLIADAEGIGVARADVVIEAIFENLEAKRGLLRSLESNIRRDAMLATNTSAIPLESLCQVLDEPSRLIGLHFFNPVAQMPLVEVVSAEGVADRKIREGCMFAAQIDKLPLPVKSAPGFLVNRVLGTYLLEAMAAVDEGVSNHALDHAARAFGMPMGPVELADTVGLDICLGVLGEQSGERADRARRRLRGMVDAGNLGRKSGRGFYSWKDGKPVQPGGSAGDSHALRSRLVDAYIAECEAALADRIVEDPDLLDAGMIFGTGFPPFLGGPLHHMQAFRGESSGAA